MASDEPERDTTFLYGFARRGDTGALVTHLADADEPVVRRRAAELLGEFDDLPRGERQREVRQGLIDAVVEEDDASVRARAIDALYRHGRESLEALIGRLADEDVGRTPDWVTADRLVTWLDAEYPEFRLVAAAALGELGDTAVVPELLDALEDTDPRVRARALRSVGRLGDDRCVPYLRARLTDDSVPVQRAAVTALASVGSDGALESLLPVVTGAGAEPIRRMAADELGEFEDNRAFDALLDALADDSRPVVRAALLSLLDLVAAAPDERVSDLRERVADRLRDRERDVSVPPLVEVFEESPRPGRREHAVWLLGHVLSGYDETVVEQFLEALDSDHEAVASAAQAGLERLYDPEIGERLRIYRERGEASAAALDRAADILDTAEDEPPGEVVTNSVDITYVREPSDYTSSRRDENEESDGE